MTEDVRQVITWPLMAASQTTNSNAWYENGEYTAYFCVIPPEELMDQADLLALHHDPMRRRLFGVARSR